MRALQIFLLIMAILFMQGCSSFSHTNKKLQQEVLQTKATFKITQDRGETQQKVLFILSLSGGGSRAAYWSASIMLAMQDVFEEVDLLKEVDIISAVSGGSLPAAYYVISKDTNDTSNKVRLNREWNSKIVKGLMAKNYKYRWLGNWFRPDNILKFWFTAYDRSDIMAQTLTNNLFDSKLIGLDFKFGDIEVNTNRPYIVLNATNGTTGATSRKFTFTHDDFIKINSNINEYQVGRAVMATACSPAAFNYMTLRDFTKSDSKKYVHVFDGGVVDNLGLKSVEEIIEINKSEYSKIVVILVDSFTGVKGVNSDLSDARNFFDYVIDLNVLDCFDNLLSANRTENVEKFKKKFFSDKNREVFFYHIKFEDLKNKDKLNSIETDFKINKTGREQIDYAVKSLIVKENPCLCAIKDILVSGKNNYGIRDCSWNMIDNTVND
jgi:NTE family protein